MLVFNEFRPDMRVYNEALMLQNQKNFTVKVLALKKRKEVQEEEKMRGGIEVKRIQVPERELYLNFFMPLYRTTIIPLLYRYARDEGADIYHCHDIYTLPAGVKLKRKDEKPVIYDAHEPNYGTFLGSKPLPGMPSKVREVFANTYERTAAGKMDGMIVTTDFAKEVKKKKGYRVPLHVIPYRANPDYFNPDLRSPGLEEKYKDKRVIVFVGGISHTKGFFELLSAFKILKKSIENAYLLIVGEVVPWLEPKRAISELGLSDSVEITKYLPYWEVAPYINTAELGLMLSSPKMENYRLTLPNKIIDYMACGKPFIGTRLPQVEKIVNEENCGILVDSENSEDIAEAMKKVLTDPDFAKDMGRNGLKAVEKEYSWEAVERNLSSIFENIIVD